MHIAESPRRDGLLTTMLKSIDPQAAKLHHEGTNIITAAALETKEKLVAGGDVVGLLSVISYDNLLRYDEERNMLNRKLIIQAAEIHKNALPPESVLPYDTFIYCVKNAETFEEILHAVPKEWMGKIPQKDASPARLK
jgi:hypothetical protein